MTSMPFSHEEWLHQNDLFVERYREIQRAKLLVERHWKDILDRKDKHPSSSNQDGNDIKYPRNKAILTDLNRLKNDMRTMFADETDPLKELFRNNKNIYLLLQLPVNLQNSKVYSMKSSESSQSLERKDSKWGNTISPIPIPTPEQLEAVNSKVLVNESLPSLASSTNANPLFFSGSPKIGNPEISILKQSPSPINILKQAKTVGSPTISTTSPTSNSKSQLLAFSDKRNSLPSSPSSPKHSHLADHDYKHRKSLPARASPSALSPLSLYSYSSDSLETSPSESAAYSVATSTIMSPKSPTSMISTDTTVLSLSHETKKVSGVAELMAAMKADALRNVFKNILTNIILPPNMNDALESPLPSQVESPKSPTGMMSPKSPKSPTSPVSFTSAKSEMTTTSNQPKDKDAEKKEKSKTAARIKILSKLSKKPLKIDNAEACTLLIETLGTYFSFIPRDLVTFVQTFKGEVVNDGELKVEMQALNYSIMTDILVHFKTFNRDVVGVWLARECFFPRYYEASRISYQALLKEAETTGNIFDLRNVALAILCPDNILVKYLIMLEHESKQPQFGNLAESLIVLFDMNGDLSFLMREFLDYHLLSVPQTCKTADELFPNPNNYLKLVLQRTCASFVTGRKTICRIINDIVNAKISEFEIDPSKLLQYGWFGKETGVGNEKKAKENVLAICRMIEKIVDSLTRKLERCPKVLQIIIRETVDHLRKKMDSISSEDVCLKVFLECLIYPLLNDVSKFDKLPQESNSQPHVKQTISNILAILEASRLNKVLQGHLSPANSRITIIKKRLDILVEHILQSKITEKDRLIMYQSSPVTTMQEYQTALITLRSALISSKTRLPLKELKENETNGFSPLAEFVKASLRVKMNGSKTSDKRPQRTET